MSAQKSAFVLPDISPCPECIKEILSPQSRFYRYVFTSCCYCGPRYSIIKQQPYDRIRTSMAGFITCSRCEAEYKDPENRRFHSQTIACPDCGPQLTQVGGALPSLQRAINYLKQGNIIALKGVGGFQLMVDATNNKAVKRLRVRKQRPYKPFALLVETCAEAQSLCQINTIEQQALRSHQSPIVLLKRLNSCNLPESVAGDSNLLGIMLPASPLHYLLAHDFKRPLIVTSGNRSNEPICINDEEALAQLGNIADYFLSHDREIIRPLDDSIVRIINNQPTILRRARGYTPFPITISQPIDEAIAVGGHLKNTVAVSLGKQLILSQHLGDLNSVASQQLFQQTLTDLHSFYSLNPLVVSHDLHPDYHSSRTIQALPQKKQVIQHHYAHILSCMAEHNLQKPVLGFAWDGTGLGTDNTVWGSECLLATRHEFQRIAHFREFSLVGGNKVANEPRRSALGLLYEIYGEELFKKNFTFLSAFSRQELKLLQQSLNKQLNTPKTSSMGRLFDAVASLLDLCHLNQFEGQAAMLLEQLAVTSETKDQYSFKLLGNNPVIIDWQNLFVALLTDLNQLHKADIAAKFHNTLAKIILQIANNFQQPLIVLTGGCFQNKLLVEICVKELEQFGFSVYTHQKVPPNDGGLALGQLYALNHEI